MIWIIDNNSKESYKIVGTNIHYKSEDQFELWATKPSDKTVKLISRNDVEEVMDYKAAIDYAIAKGSKTFKL